jgi:ABC-2 type transport system ATP-binding protein
VTPYIVQDSADPAIEARGLVKNFGSHRALDGFDLTVEPGIICGLLGPNGAGKTTAVRILATLLRADGGRATVAGCDVAARPGDVRSRIGLSGQTPAVDEILSGRQNLVLFSRLNGLDRGAARRRAGELLEQFDLTEAADRPVKKYSGGMRRRLDLAVTLILAPAVLFLDEPTTGLDPRNRREVWNAIRHLVDRGTTVLLTTQYLDEADQLASDIAVLDHGRVIARGSPDALKARIGGDRVEVTVADPADAARAAEAIVAAVGVAPEAHPDGRTLTVHVAERVPGLTAIVTVLGERRIGATDVGLRRPTLDDAFLELTGHRTEAAP